MSDPKNQKAADLKFYNDTKVTCACGATFVTGSTKQQINVDICSACHPFFTGEMKYVDTQGRVEKFIQQRQAAQSKNFIKKKDRRRLKQKKEEIQAKSQKTLKEMLKK